MNKFEVKDFFRNRDRVYIYLVTFSWGNSIRVHAKTPKDASKWVEEHYLTDSFHIKCVGN